MGLHSRRDFIKTSSLAGMALATGAGNRWTGFEKREKPMNILFLLADDLRWNSLGCAGNDVVITPEIDKLAKDGIRFGNARVTTSICMVSRASLLTGQHMSRHGIDRFMTPLSDEAIESTYPAVLRKDGYHTGYVGKYGVDHIKAGQFDFYREYEGQHWISDDNGNTVHVTQKNLNDAMTFLNHRPAEKPFCLTVGFFATHAEDNNLDQYCYQPGSEKLFKDTVIPIPETASSEFLKGLPPFINSEENEGRRRWHWRFDTPEKYQHYMKAYYRMLAEVDHVVGELVATLKKEGVYENTLILFMGDNGYFQSEHQLADKWYPYEESVRVPLVVHDPRLPAGKRGMVNDEYVLNIDIAPFILAAAGRKIPGGMQGRDFSVLYDQKEKADWRQDFYYAHPVVMNEKRIPASEAVIARDSKYIFWPDYNYEEFFDLGKDSKEKTNRISDPAYAQKIESLKERFKILKDSAR
jgi:arylsulfatase A-like enzyme